MQLLSRRFGTGLLLMSLCHAPHAHAGAGFLWDPTDGEGDLDADASWLGGVAPEATDSAIFSTPGGTTTARLDLPTFTIAGISIQSGDTVFDLGNNHTFSAGVIELGLSGDPASMDLQSGIIVGHSLLAGDGVGAADVGLNVAGGTELSVVGSLTALSDVAVTLDGGQLSVGSLNLDNAINFLSGTLTVDEDLAWSDMGSPTSLTLGASHHLTSTGQLTLDAADQLTLDGGSLSVQALVGAGTLDYVSGSLSVATGIDIGTGGDITSSVTLLAGDSWQSDGTMNIDAGYGLTVDGGSISGDTVGVTAGAVFTLSSGSAALETLASDGSVVINGGTLTLMHYHSSPGASLAINGPAFIRLTQQDLRLEPGADWGDALTIADGSTLQVDHLTHIGTTGPATLTLGAGATFQTTELVLGDQAAFNLGPTASLQANTVTNEDALMVEDYLVPGVQPWTAPIVTLNNRGTLTYNTPGTAIVPAHLTGNGTLHVMDGTLVLDRTSPVETETLTHHTMLIDAGAELVLRDDRSMLGSFNVDRLTFSTGASPSLLNDGLLTLDHIAVQLLSPYAGSGAVHLSELSQVVIRPDAGPITFHELTAESSSTFYRSDFENGTIELTILRSSGLSTFFDEPINVTFGEDVTISSDGIGVEGDLTNIGILRLADGAEVYGNNFGPTFSNRLNAPGATILLGDGSRFTPEGGFQNFGTVAVVGTGTGTVGVSSLTGNGVFDAREGRLEVYINTSGTWSGQFLGGADSETLIDVNNILLTLTSTGMIDTDGDLTFTSGGANTVVAAPLHVGGLLTIGEDDIVEIADPATAFDIGRLAMTDDAILRITSGQDVSTESLTILESGASNPGSVTIDTAGQFDIGADGITDGQQLRVIGGGTLHVAGDVVGLGGFFVDGSRLELAGSSQAGVGLQNGAELVVLAGGSLTGINIDGDSSGERLINHGTITIDDGEEWRDLAIENHGSLHILSGQGLNTRNADSFLLTGDLIAEAGSYLQFRGLEQTAAGDFQAAGTVRLYENHQFAGRVDLDGALLELFGATLVFDATADVQTLGDVNTRSGAYFDGQTGAAITVDDLVLTSSLLTHLSNPDPIHVHGRLDSAANRYLAPAAIVSGVVSPGRNASDNYNRLQFRRGLTLEDGARVELDITREQTFDWLDVWSELVVHDGVTLDLTTDPDEETDLLEGTSVRLISTTFLIDGAFDTVEGLVFGDGLQWHLTYDATGLLAEVGLAGDVDGDGLVGVEDLDVLLAQWGHEYSAGTGADVSGDGWVGDDDLNIVLANWGNSSSAGANIPEPGTLCLLAPMFFARRRRRVG